MRLGEPLSGEYKAASPCGLAVLATTPECLPQEAQHPVPKDPEARDFPDARLYQVRFEILACPPWSFPLSSKSTRWYLYAPPLVV